MKIRLTTFNIQHGRNHNLPGDVIDLPLMAETAAGTGAAIFGFNEVRRGQAPDDGAFPDTPAILGRALQGEAVFGKAISLGPGRDYGNALVSRCPVVQHEVVPIPDPAEEEKRSCFEARSILRALIDAGGTKLTLLLTHFGLSPEERRSAADTVLALAKDVKTPLVLMGDLNSTPDDPVIRSLKTELTDAAAALHREEPTFSSDAPERRIDFIFLKGCKPLEIHTVQKIASDHFALTAEIELPDD